MGLGEKPWAALANHSFKPAAVEVTRLTLNEATRTSIDCRSDGVSLPRLLQVHGENSPKKCSRFEPVNRCAKTWERRHSCRRRQSRWNNEGDKSVAPPPTGPLPAQPATSVSSG